MSRREASRTLEPSEIEAADRYCEDYIGFMNAAKTEREAVEWAVRPPSRRLCPLTGKCP